MEYTSILEYIREEVENAPKVTFSQDVKVDAEKLLDLLKDLESTLPREIEEAQDIVSREKEILDNAQRSAQSIMQRAEDEAQRLVEETEVMQKANAQAEATITQSRAAADEIRRSGDQYVEDILTDTEHYLTAQLQQVQKNLDAMKNR